jgi:cell wall-associated NlpC family hydrolase
VPMPVPVRLTVHTLLATLAIVVATLLVAAPADARTLSKGSRGAEVRTLQKLLRQAGFQQKIDGVFGRGTYRNLRRLERELELKVDGRLTSAEMRRVRAALKPAEGSGGFSADAMNRPRAVSSQEAAGAKAQLTADGLAIPPAAAPEAVKKVIAAANEIAKTPYRYGGGHGRWKDTGYDCSGSVSYALHGGGLLDASMPSGGFMNWGEAGEGEWITTYAHGGHMYMVVAGLRFDTSGRSKTGSRWQRSTRSSDGFTVRHPEGF